MNASGAHAIHALLFGLSEDIAGQLLAPLLSMCSVRATDVDEDVSSAGVQVIFRRPDTEVVGRLRASNPATAIIVVSKHPENADWLDSIEAGATDYCAAPFESAQVKWIVDSSLRAVQPGSRH